MTIPTVVIRGVGPRPSPEALDVMIANGGDPYQLGDLSRPPIPSVPATETAVCWLGSDGRWYAEAHVGDGLALTDGETPDVVTIARQRAREDYERNERVRAGGSDPADSFRFYETGPGPIVVSLPRRNGENQIAFIGEDGLPLSQRPYGSPRYTRPRRSEPASVILARADKLNAVDYPSNMAPISLLLDVHDVAEDAITELREHLITQTPTP